MIRFRFCKIQPRIKATYTTKNDVNILSQKENLQNDFFLYKSNLGSKFIRAHDLFVVSESTAWFSFSSIITLKPIFRIPCFISILSLQ